MKYKKINKVKKSNAVINKKSVFSISDILAQDSIDSLWDKKEYEILERILKSEKKASSDVFYENIGKLNFFQYEKKLVGNAPSFVSHILTGGASLILRNAIYHHDIPDEIMTLSNELKLVFAQLRTKRKLAWEQSVFDAFVDYEANILIQVLQRLIQKNELNFDIVPTPSFLMIYNTTNKQVGQDFLHWLSAESASLFQLYHKNSFHIAFWALTGEKLSDINPILKSLDKHHLHPYLRLALMLRSEREIVKFNEFTNLKEDDNIFKNIAIETIKNRINLEGKIKLSPFFWGRVFDFYSILEDQELGHILTQRLIHTLAEQHKNRESLNFTGARYMANQIKNHDLVKKIDALISMQQVGQQFLLNLEDEKKSKRMITNIKTEQDLMAHLTLIGETCFLFYSELFPVLFLHMKRLVKNKRLKKILPLEDIFDLDFDCACLDCQNVFYNHEILEMQQKLNLPSVRLPNVSEYSMPQLAANEKIPKLSVLLQSDPFSILNVSIIDTKQTIMQKVMKLIQQSPGKMAIYRQAQSELFDPKKRFLHHYLRYLASESSPEPECVYAN